MHFLGVYPEIIHFNINYKLNFDLLPIFKDFIIVIIITHPDLALPLFLNYHPTFFYQLKKKKKKIINKNLKINDV